MSDAALYRASVNDLITASAELQIDIPPGSAFIDNSVLSVVSQRSYDKLRTKSRSLCLTRPSHQCLQDSQRMRDKNTDAPEDALRLTENTQLPQH